MGEKQLKVSIVITQTQSFHLLRCRPTRSELCFLPECVRVENIFFHLSIWVESFRPPVVSGSQSLSSFLSVSQSLRIFKIHSDFHCSYMMLTSAYYGQLLALPFDFGFSQFMDLLTFSRPPHRLFCGLHVILPSRLSL